MTSSLSLEWLETAYRAIIVLIAAMTLGLFLRLLINIAWYVFKAQDFFALKFKDQEIIMRPSSIPHFLFGMLTSAFRTLPNVHLIGAAKSGTSSLYDYLIQHPCVHGSILMKETHYFIGRSIFRNDLDAYHKFFGKYLNLDKLLFRSFFPSYFSKFYHQFILKKEKYLVLEGTPTLRFPEVAKRIGAIQKNQKGIIVLRDPIERAYSHYRMLKSYFPEWETRTFEQAVIEEMDEEEKGYGLAQALSLECCKQQSLKPVFQQQYWKHSGSNLTLWYFDKLYCRYGHYANLVPPFIDAFGGKDNVLVLSFESLAKEPQKTAAEVCDFLSISQFDHQKARWEVKNASSLKKSKTARDMLSSQTLYRLEAYYKDTYKYLEVEFGIKLDAAKTILALYE